MLACAKGSCRCSCVDPAWTRALWRCAGNCCESCLWWRGWGMTMWLTAYAHSSASIESVKEILGECDVVRDDFGC
ncbi:hypothetical protein HBI56_155420 [Parastagonospora nodorum]|nr:hypothetical protein HBH52_140440 [Parastagonospora nodorum]KAH3998510.1 hypothetical protein HBI10_127400 [Parastagonospora nodorum]KAH4024033.1 hypothetical protein HBI13_082140 [Parastagonospora nodorum]KAH4072383.1 hypothetical protein HBH50_058920 [Parastagonospora nodorum]KAH4088949.1 hypothetical protein HBH48_121000 [Parastagonospora nodorum]